VWVCCWYPHYYGCNHSRVNSTLHSLSLSTLTLNWINDLHPCVIAEWPKTRLKMIASNKSIEVCVSYWWDSTVYDELSKRSYAFMMVTSVHIWYWVCQIPNQLYASISPGTSYKAYSRSGSSKSFSGCPDHFGGQHNKAGSSVERWISIDKFHISVWRDTPDEWTNHRVRNVRIPETKNSHPTVSA
jgi:hypothetical protein